MCLLPWLPCRSENGETTQFHTSLEEAWAGLSSRCRLTALRIRARPALQDTHAHACGLPQTSGTSAPGSSGGTAGAGSCAEPTGDSSAKAVSATQACAYLAGVLKGCSKRHIAGPRRLMGMQVSRKAFHCGLASRPPLPSDPVMLLEKHRLTALSCMGFRSL